MTTKTSKQTRAMRRALFSALANGGLSNSQATALYVQCGKTFKPPLRQHLLSAMTGKGVGTYTTAIKYVTAMTGGIKGVPLPVLQAAKFDKRYAPTLEGAPALHGASSWATIGMQRNGGKIEKMAYLQPHIGQAKSRAERRERDKGSLKRAQIKAIKDSKRALLNW